MFQVASQNIENPFSPEEKITYGAYYNWHFIWINAGEVIFSADTTQYHNQPAWDFKAIGKTYKTYDLFYSVRDTFESYVTLAGFEPLWFRRAVNHGKGHSIHQYEFSKGTNQIISNIQRGNRPSSLRTIPYQTGILDLLSTAYHFRSYNFDEMTKGQKVNFTMLVDNKTEDLFFRYLGKEEVKTREGRKFNCHLLSVWLLEGDFFPEGEYMKIWVTADKNQLPIMVETQIKVGSVKAIFIDAENLKNPLSSEITDNK